MSVDIFYTADFNNKSLKQLGVVGIGQQRAHAFVNECFLVSQHHQRFCFTAERRAQGVSGTSSHTAA